MGVMKGWRDAMISSMELGGEERKWWGSGCVGIGNEEG